MGLHRKKQQQHNEEQNVDDWLMTYADMITLLLCFFAIFLSASVPKKDVFSQMRSGVMERFAAAGVPGASPASATKESEPEDEAESQEVGHGIKEITFEDEAEPEETAKEEEKAGDRLSSIDMNSASFFGVGASTLSDEGKGILDGVLETVRSPQYADHTITIEGHTDDSPINTLQFPSNWELSTARASAVARYFLEQGIPPQRLRASGYADVFPKVPNRDEAGRPLPENQAQNRRVVIKLEKVEKGR